MNSAIIMVGGLGTRLRPLTEKIPKPMLPVAGTPLLEHLILHLKSHNVTNIVLAISYHADKIKEYFGDGKKFGVNISYSFEKEPLGTGGGVKQASEGIKEPFLLVWGDILMGIDFKKMYETHKKNKASITMALTQREDTENWGVVVLKGDKIIGFTEKPPREKAPSNFVNAGSFIIEPKVLEMLPEGKSSLEKQCFEIVAKEEGKMYSFIYNGPWFPIDTIEKYAIANAFWRKPSF